MIRQVTSNDKYHLHLSVIMIWSWNLPFWVSNLGRLTCPLSGPFGSVPPNIAVLPLCSWIRSLQQMILSNCVFFRWSKSSWVVSAYRLLANWLLVQALCLAETKWSNAWLKNAAEPSAVPMRVWSAPLKTAKQFYHLRLIKLSEARQTKGVCSASIINFRCLHHVDHIKKSSSATHSCLSGKLPNWKTNG